MFKKKPHMGCANARMQHTFRLQRQEIARLLFTHLATPLAAYLVRSVVHLVFADAALDLAFPRT